MVAWLPGTDPRQRPEGHLGTDSPRNPEPGANTGRRRWLSEGQQRGCSGLGRPTWSQPWGRAEDEGPTPRIRESHPGGKSSIRKPSREQESEEAQQSCSWYRSRGGRAEARGAPARWWAVAGRSRGTCRPPESQGDGRGYRPTAGEMGTGGGEGGSQPLLGTRGTQRSLSADRGPREEGSTARNESGGCHSDAAIKPSPAMPASHLSTG